MLFPTTRRLKVANKSILPINIHNIIPDRFMPIPMLTRASVDMMTHKTNFSTIGTEMPVLHEIGSKTFSNENSRRSSIDRSIKPKNKKSGYLFSSIPTERVDDLKGLMTSSIQSRPLMTRRPEAEVNTGHLPVINTTETLRNEQNYGNIP